MKIKYIALIGLFCTQLSIAEPIVIKDYGNTRPSGIPSHEDVMKLARKLNVHPKELVSFLPYSFPTRSSMTYGKFEKNIKHHKENVNPFFIIGGEEGSLAWLLRNKQYLLNSGITRGLLTNVYTAKEFKEIAEKAAPLQLFVMNTDEIGKEFNIANYPVVITHEEIKQ